MKCSRNKNVFWFLIMGSLKVLFFYYKEVEVYYFEYRIRGGSVFYWMNDFNSVIM